MSRAPDIRGPAGTCQRSVVGSVDDWRFFEHGAAAHSLHRERATGAAAHAAGIERSGSDE